MAAEPSPEVVSALQSGLVELQKQTNELSQRPHLRSPDSTTPVADVAVFAKAVAWMLRHNEFPKDEYAEQAQQAIETGMRRAQELAAGLPSWSLQPGTTIRGYVSTIDGSVQPYALTLPAGVDPQSDKQWPLYVKLHGRHDDMNEVNFIARHERQTLPDEQTWIQLDVYGRGNNAYRWAGETDVLEAIDDVKRRFRIDDDRITLHGFSMGGAGAWHLGMHYPDRWSSVGPGAGFVDFYNYQNRTEQLPPWQHATLGIYDSIEYALNAFNVPVCTYGGENDKQLVASTSMVAAAKAHDVSIKLLIGPGMGHKFHPDSLREFMAFHADHSAAGRRQTQQRKEIRFATRTLKYNACDWLTIEEVDVVWKPSTVRAKLTDDGTVNVTTDNVTALSLQHDIAATAIIDGIRLPCDPVAGSAQPHVVFRKGSTGWKVLESDRARRFVTNPERHKRHDLQGPIDDAFMSPFVCVRGTETPSNKQHQAWAEWTLQRFEREFDKWLRGKVQIISDIDLDDEMIASRHLILFGDPSSNAVIRRVLPDLPITWEGNTITIGNESWDMTEHGLSLIFPNPLNPAKYVVLNSGHTFHEDAFRASNAWLFPRLGDIAVQKFLPGRDGGFHEVTEWASSFDAHWQLPGFDE